MTVIIEELYDALLEVGCSRELAVAAANVSLHAKEYAELEQIKGDLTRAFEARGVEGSLAQAAAMAIIRRASHAYVPNMPRRQRYLRRLLHGWRKP